VLINFTKNITLSIVNVLDAKFILGLRQEPSLSKHISFTKPDLEEQLNWINLYKEREKKNIEYYFIINENRHPSLIKIGTVRIYNINNGIFTWGSWIIKKNAFYSAAIESALAIYSFCFVNLKLKKSIFDVKKDNVIVINIHKKFGSKIIKEDETNLYFEYYYEDFINIKKKYKRFVNEQYLKD